MVVMGNGIQIYEDSSNKYSCSNTYPLEEDDVCSDVISIPITKTSVRELTISTNHYLTLCEVQVFGGKKKHNVQASDILTFI